MDPYDFFSFGARIVNNAGDEASQRTVVSRAYYACLLTARDAMFRSDRRSTRKRRQRVLGKRKGGEHEIIITAVGADSTLGSGVAKNASDQLRELRELRVSADYHTATTPTATFEKYGAPDWAQLAHVSLALASNLIPTLKRLGRYP